MMKRSSVGSLSATVAVITTSDAAPIARPPGRRAHAWCSFYMVSGSSIDSGAPSLSVMPLFKPSPVMASGCDVWFDNRRGPMPFNVTDRVTPASGTALAAPVSAFGHADNARRTHRCHFTFSLESFGVGVTVLHVSWCRPHKLRHTA